MKIIRFIVILFVIILGVSFAILNAEPATIHYYVGSKVLPLSLIMAISFCCGLVLGLLLMGIGVFKAKTEKYHLKKRLKNAEQEVENLRTIPIKD